MTQANMELLDALRNAGTADDKARAAAQSVAAVGDVAAKEDISAVCAEMTAMRTEMTAMRAEMAAMEARLIRWMVGTISPLYVLLAFVALRLPA